jgi:diguanylate cyclase
MIDIDNFKTVNDAHGHPVGDEALRLVADTLRGSVREGDTVFRVGREEFAILLPGVTAEAALPVAERVRHAVAGIPFTSP